MRKTKIDVLIISKDFPPRIGGVATHVEHLARGIASLRRPKKPKIRPFFVHVLTLGSGRRTGLRSNLIVHSCVPDNVGGFGEDGNVPMGAAYEYWRKQRSQYGFKVDIVHAHDYQSALAGALLKRAFNSKLIVSIHRAPKWNDTTLPEWNVKECFLNLLHDANIRELGSALQPEPLVDCFVVPSNYCKRGLLEAGFDDIRVKLIRHGVPIDGLQGVQESQSALMGLRASQKAKIILCPARIDVHKGLREFVDAAATLNTLFPNLFFVVAGGASDDNLLDELIRRAKAKKVGNIQFGHALEKRDFTPKEMATLYRKATICVLPSHTENYPLVLLEAQAFRCPVVATGVGGIPEMIDSGRTGLLFEKGNTAELIDRVTILLRNERFRRELTIKASKKLPQVGNVFSMAKSYAELYREITDIKLKK